MFDEDEVIARCKERIKAGDANAAMMLGCQYNNPNSSLRQDSRKAMDLWLKAAALGSAQAHYLVGNTYMNEKGINRNMDKVVTHYRLAAIGGREKARHNLGCLEYGFGNVDSTYL